MPVKSGPLLITGAGAIVMWAALKAKAPSEVLRALLSGKPLDTVPPVDTITGSTPAAAYGYGAYGYGSVFSGTTGSTVANDALKYQGHLYVYGGAPGPNGANGWDCSSFVNWVLGHDLGMTLPGSRTPGYNGTSHGPTTVSYWGWSGAKNVTLGTANAEKQAQAGDLVVWATHMGIAIGNGRMVSALNDQLGTEVTTISGGAPKGQTALLKRIPSTAAPATGGILPTPTGQPVGNQRYVA